MNRQQERQNRLARETSPYLLQHAHNPVDWYPWGSEALARAQELDRPILLSIGYAACHWCHVMERESFENEAIAELMNDHFVCVKVDREERPDLDDIYMAATVSVTGGGGWPMTVFLAPDQRPFFAGTYFPPEDRWGRPGFRTLLTRIAEAWREEREALVEQSRIITEHLRAQSSSDAPTGVTREACERAAAHFRATFDETFGGFGKAPKFPPKAALKLLLRRHHLGADRELLSIVTRTLDGMKNGGMYDHLGGGFARYSTDERWLVPHFEKMSYDNSELAELYLDAYQVTGIDEYRRVAVETLDYVIREMQGEDGGYFSATDADSEGEEGKFFVWSLSEVRELLRSPDAEYFAAFYDVTAEGNWEGHNVLNTPRSLAAVAGELGIGQEELKDSLTRSRARLFERRMERVPPLLDDKILTAHSGLMISAMARGYLVLDDGRYLDSAIRAADCMLGQMTRPDGGLYRTARRGHVHLDGYLEDYAYLADGLVTLYEAGGPARYLSAARQLAERIVRDFASDDGPFFHTAHTHEQLIVRTREGHDGATPNPNAVAARALVRLGHHFGEMAFIDRARRAITAYGNSIERLPHAFATTLGVVDWLLQGPIEVVVSGAPDAVQPFRQVLSRQYLPNSIVAFVSPDDASSAVVSPLVRGRAAPGAEARAYVCEDFVCRTPATTPQTFAEQLATGEARRQTRSQPSLLPTP